MNHDTNAPHSSAFQGLMLLIDIHFSRTFDLSQNPLAAARSSSLVGRWGIFGRCGRCKYLDMDEAIDSESASDTRGFSTSGVSFGFPFSASFGSGFSGFLA